MLKVFIIWKLSQCEDDFEILVKSPPASRLKFRSECRKLLSESPYFLSLFTDGVLLFAHFVQQIFSRCSDCKS